MSEVLDRQADPDLNGLKLRRETGTLRVPGPSDEGRLHRVAVVGGGAAGLELVTRLGNRHR
jgi:NADH:quinone reductase (non-electrogenic)